MTSPAFDVASFQKVRRTDPAEAGFGAAKVTSGSIQAADRLGIRIATARTQLDRVLAKTGRGAMGIRCN